MKAQGPSSDIVFAGKNWAEVENSTLVNPQSRHESGYVEFGGKFYLLGGRGLRALNIFNPDTRTWTTGASIPGNKEIHHFQAVVCQNKIFIIGAFTGGFPDEKPVGDIYIYDPLVNKWTVKTNAIPLQRRRGAAGTVVYNDKIYLAGGITNGHTNGWVSWTDVYNPASGEWRILPNAPHQRDHFNAAIIKHKLYAAAGRKTGFTSLLGDTEPVVDVFDLKTETWSSLPSGSNLPTPRAGNGGIAIDDKLLIAGGESAANGAHAEVELFDPATGRWTELPSLVNGRHGTQPVLYKGTVYMASGYGYIGSAGDELLSQEFISLINAVPGKTPLVKKLIPNQVMAISEGARSLKLSDFFADDQGISELRFTIVRNSNPILFSSVSITDSVFKISQVLEKTGNSAIKIRATDPDGFFVEDEFIVNVINPNPTPPVVSSPLADHKVPVNAGTVAIDLTDVFNDDKPFDSLTLSILQITDSSVITSAAIIDNELTLTFPPNKIGITEITIKATDKDSLSVQDVFTLEVISKSRTFPVVTTPLNDFRLPVNSAPRLVNLRTIFTDDQPEEQLTYSIVSNSNPTLVETSLTNDNLEMEFSPGHTGKADIKIRATDKEGQFTQDEFSVILFQPGAIPVKDIKINSGGSKVVKNGVEWLADQNFSGGSSYMDSGIVAGTDNSLIYQTERYGNFSYAIPLPVGKYSVKLHFAEIYWQVKGERVFNAIIENGNVKLSNYDIIPKAGAPFTAVVETLDSVSVTDDTLNISFQSLVDNAKLSALEVISLEKHVLNSGPFVSLAIPDQEIPFALNAKQINIYKVFSDDKGSVPLKITVDHISDTTIISKALITGVALNLTKSTGASGKVTIRLRATDKEGLWTTEEFLVTAAEPAPEKPKVIQPLDDMETAYNVAIAPIDVDSVFTDNRGAQGLKLSVKQNTNPAIVRAATIKNGKLTLTLAKNITGMSIITIVATDVDGFTAEDRFSITIKKPDNIVSSRLLINCGGESHLIKDENWLGDQYFTGGSTYQYDDHINKMGDPIYGSERYGTHSYHIPLANGSYTLKLHFMELYWNTPGQRVFNVAVENGQGTLTNYDIIQKTGIPGKLVIEEFKGVQVTDGVMNIDILSIVNYAKISAIEIFSSPATEARILNGTSIQEQRVSTGSFKIYPNPVVSAQMIVELPADYTGKNLDLTIMDMNGAVVYRKPEIRNAGRQMTVNMQTKLARGTYLVKLQEKEKIYLSKIIVQ